MTRKIRNGGKYKMDIITLAAAKKYTKETAEGLGAIKGQDGARWINLLRGFSASP